MATGSPRIGLLEGIHEGQGNSLETWSRQGTSLTPGGRCWTAQLGFHPSPPLPLPPGSLGGTREDRSTGQWLQGRGRHSDKGWAGLCEGEALCWQIRSQARSASALNLTPTHLPQTPLPQGEKENSYLLAQPWGRPGSSLSGHFLALSQPPAPLGKKIL